MSKRFTDTDLFKKQFIKSLPTDLKLFWIYLYHDCNHAGIWENEPEVVNLRLGMKVDQDRALSVFNKGEKRVIVLNGGSKWFIKPFIPFQYNCEISDLNRENRVHLSVLKALEEEKIKGLVSPLRGAKDKDKDKDMDKDKNKERVRGLLSLSASQFRDKK